MSYFIGIDGGSSKADFALYRDSGELVATHKTSCISYAEIGIDTVCTILEQSIAQLSAGIDRSDIKGVCFGMPCFDEQPEKDHAAARQIEQALGLPMRFENDVACAWAGPLAFQSGISMLAGTGAVAWGYDVHGVMHRCGGWSHAYSDEGSGYWLGLKTLEYFTKQSDGRLARGPLYDIVREHFALKNDWDLINIVDEQYLPSRKGVASLQPLLLRAAHEGDQSALALYEKAANEFVMMIKALRNRIDLKPGSPVSYAGGLFGAGEVLLGPLKKALAETDMVFIEPILTPIDGALLLAVDRFDPEKLDPIRQARILLKNS